MNSTILRMATVFGMFGFGEDSVASKPEKKKSLQLQSRARRGSINSKMKIYREHKQGTMNRRIARTVVKAVIQLTKREKREHGRKTDPKRHLRFA